MTGPFYRERIALPPGAAFEAVLEVVSLTDALSIEISRDGAADCPGPPFSFALPCDPAAIDPSACYNVQATRRTFVSDSAHPVIAGGAPTEVEIAMRQVARTAEASGRRGMRGMRGMVTHFADAARFVDNAPGASYPVAMEADFPALEAAVLARRAGPEMPILVTIEGDVAMRDGLEGGEVAPVVVRRFVAVWPGLGCN